MKLTQQRVWREYSSRGADEAGTTSAGILFRRARDFERSGVLEAEAAAERRAEAELRSEAARRLVESRTLLERSSTRNRHHGASDSEDSGSEDDILGRRWKNQAQTEDGDSEGEGSVRIRVTAPNGEIEPATRHNERKTDGTTNAGRTDNNAQISSRSSTKLNPRHQLRRTHTSPMLLSNGAVDKPNISKKPTKRVKSALTVSRVAVETSSGDESLVGEHDAGRHRGNQRTLPKRKTGVCGNMIQPAYFRSRSVEGNFKGFSPTSTSTNIRRAASRQDQQNTGKSSHTDPNRTDANSARRKRPLRLTPTLPSSPTCSSLLGSKSPSPSTSPESGNSATSSPKTHVRRAKRNVTRNQPSLQPTLYVPKATKRERRYIVPDKKEMLLILEEQKRELQVRIDRFLEREIMRSKLESGDFIIK